MYDFCGRRAIFNMEVIYKCIIYCLRNVIYCIRWGLYSVLQRWKQTVKQEVRSRLACTYQIFMGQLYCYTAIRRHNLHCRVYISLFNSLISYAILWNSVKTILFFIIRLYIHVSNVRISRKMCGMYPTLSCVCVLSFCGQYIT